MNYSVYFLCTDETHIVITICYFYIAVTVFFGQSTYNVDEYNHVVQPVLIFTIPSQINITVYVRDNMNTAVGELSGLTLQLFQCIFVV